MTVRASFDDLTDPALKKSRRGADPRRGMGSAVPRVSLVIVNDVWAVHATLANEVRPTQAIVNDERAAYASELSGDSEVLAASVIRFVLDELGTRRNVAMFVRGQRQSVP